MAELKKYQMYIDGQWVNSESEKTFESFNPATEEPWAIIPEAGANDVDRAVKAAHRAFTEGPWANMTATERGKLLRRLADITGGTFRIVGTGRDYRYRKIIKGNTVASALYLRFFSILCRTCGQGSWRHLAH